MSFSPRQRIMKIIYPFLTWLGAKKAKQRVLKNENQMKPPLPFYNLTITLNNGKEFSFETLRGKKVILVNTASDCGYTAQYAELQTLYQQHKEGLTIIGFPANDFKEQEKGSDEDIASFCAINYGVNFPLTKKTVVIKNDSQNSVFEWLSNKQKNGWNSQPPEWNFCKYVINEKGWLTHYFPPQISPLSKEVVSAINV